MCVNDVRMEKDHYNLKWNNHNHTFIALLDYFRIQKRYCDATIACDGQVYPVHQLVLSACSDFFASIFESTSYQNPVVVLQDVSRQQLESLLLYMYRGEVQVHHQVLPSFIKTAESLQIKGLAIPTKDNTHPIRNDNGQWRQPIQSPNDQSIGGSRAQRQSPEPVYPMVQRIPITYEATSPRLHQSHGMTHHHVDNRLLAKRSHHIPKRTECLSPDKLHQKRKCIRSEVFDVEHEIEAPSSASKAKSSPQLHEDKAQLQNSSCEGQKDNMADNKRERNTYTSVNNRSSSHGTFQTLVISEECKVKDEPQDSVDSYDYDTNPLYISEDDDIDSKSEETSLISLGMNADTGTAHSPLDVGSADHQEPENANDYAKESAVIAGKPDELGRSDSHISQLRRELLRPVQQRGSHNFVAQPPVQSIPHPVIASRDVQPQLREPPPLMKIPSRSPVQVKKQESVRSHEIRKESPASNHSSHLLVKAPPTYRSPSNHFSFQIHNQQLGEVVVTGATPVMERTETHPPVTVSPLHDNVPLNLSGQESSSNMPHQNRKMDPFLGKIVTNRRRRLRGPKSWEFLIRLLQDPSTNPHLIRWENKEIGIFRLMQPAIIAQRWGRRTGKHGNESLTYDNFARGLRYHYATGALQAVSERSFVYKFGPKAFKILRDNERS